MDNIIKQIWEDLETILSDKLANNHNRDLSIYTEDEQEAISLMAFLSVKWMVGEY